MKKFNMENKKPQHAQCKECEYVWAVAYMPMPLHSFAKICESAMCPFCASKHVVLRIENETN